ncbi:MAG: hypothetical protein QXU32_07315 [Nitrososphaerales archaeon]
MITYIVKEMLKHVVVRLVLSATFAVLRHRRSPAEYNIRLIKQGEREFLISAAIIGISFGILTIWLVMMLKGQENILTVVAGILLSIGLSQQIMSIGLDAITLSLNGFISIWNSILFLFARQKPTPEWRFIENESSQIFIYPHIVYVLPEELSESKVGTTKLIQYITEHSSELEYPKKICDEEPSLLSFAQYAIEFIRDRLTVYDRLSNIQQRTGAVNPVVFIALGTLIWLLS